MTVEQALQLLKEEGYKFTGKREQMIRIFDREKRYLSAKDILEYMQEDYPGLSYDTIYRNLTLFENMGILEATELGGERIYRFRCSTDEHHHHLICLSCGKARHIKSCPLDAMLGEPAEFTITGHKFEIYGYCTDCKPAK
ncbi:Fur family transcriptional regulator [Effusibacillus lacus]|uniref:Transcriptional repressor n=1 Tax=Effusibacillus lacus TaxID=1348429 RepID=A0A292YGZ9_9BACL|nr:Fur family transcriptional regulator [Effusibacillus lacus]GAX89967.1 transcriptional repressor [Effusibacillus lacus]